MMKAKEDREFLICKECHEELPKDLFQKRGFNKKSGKRQYDSRCKPCMKDHRNHNWTQERIIFERLNFVNQVKLKCHVCGYDRCKAGLDFHHIDDNKEFTIAKMVHSRNSKVSIKTLKAEVEKCVVLCCRCHREVHEGLIAI